MTDIKNHSHSFVNNCLFYPSSGRDVDLPISTFMNDINEFWFVDRSYQIKKPFFQGAKFNLRLESKNYEILAGKTLITQETFQVKIRHENYIHTPTGRTITLKFCRARGYDLFRTVFKKHNKKISIFFHRGDSIGEGGSNFYWLGKKMIKFVFDQLEDNALLVSDGSNATKKLSIFHNHNNVSKKLISNIQPITIGHQPLQCIGDLGERYGPTLVWKVNKTEATPKK
jgi:hypothetical protein